MGVCEWFGIHVKLQKEKDEKKRGAFEAESRRNDLEKRCPLPDSGSSSRQTGRLETWPIDSQIELSYVTRVSGRIHQCALNAGGRFCPPESHLSRR
ncbi:hypothetical protein CEXT_116351 [Caerostris extrusa]|uniref:Uncharacterized protein n=1 Tax=Caerostris extrusa TaxID=172846 RepID=A0AAV4WWY1_CAEEX|nr:hypothetical protein CEXT_116351 [Caerostris extrusa]